MLQDKETEKRWLVNTLVSGLKIRMSFDFDVVLTVHRH